jgi:hypothetical protein
MAGKMLTADELITLLARLLTDVVGSKDAEWRKRMTIEPVNLTFSPRSNWRIEAKGSAKQREAIVKAVDVVRDEHPYVRWP